MMFNKFAVFALVAGVANAAQTYNYDDTTDKGPSNWANLNIQDNQCGGSKNSPIAFPSTTCETFEAFYEFDGGDCSLDDLEFKTVDNGVKAFFPDASVCKANRMKIPNVDGIYQAAQYHIHIDTEHTFEGSSYEFELHIVHAKVTGSGSSSFPDGVGGTNPFAVYGYAIKAGGSTNEQFQAILDKWIAAQNAKVASCTRRLEEESSNLRKLAEDVASEQAHRELVTPFDIYSLVEEKNFYHYGGGLTTPPCTEAVWFNIAQEPIVISDAQAATLRNIILDYRDDECGQTTKADPASGTTARPVQPTGNRDVQLICAEDPSLLSSDLYLEVGPVNVSVDSLESIVEVVGGLFGGITCGLFGC